MSFKCCTKRLIPGVVSISLGPSGCCHSENNRWITQYVVSLPALPGIRSESHAVFWPEKEGAEGYLCDQKKVEQLEKFSFETEVCLCSRGNSFKVAASNELSPSLPTSSPPNTPQSVPLTPLEPPSTILIVGETVASSTAVSSSSTTDTSLSVTLSSSTTSSSTSTSATTTATSSSSTTTATHAAVGAIAQQQHQPQLSKAAGSSNSIVRDISSTGGVMTG
ncbi:hypothetical protein DMENIID0001_027720 [Sergentomyia squamirostris]